MRVAAILPAAGHGTRMGRDLGDRYGSPRKQFMKLRGVSILQLTVQKFLAIDRIRQVLVAVPEGWVSSTRRMLSIPTAHGRVRVLAGGPSRQESVGRCLDATADTVDVVAVHDGVRPFVPVQLIERALDHAAVRGAVIPGMPAEETVKQVSQTVVQSTIPRERLMLVQTPQVFETSLLRRAFEQARRDGFSGTDESSLVEHLGEDVFVMRGSERNIKITRPHHLALAELYYEEEQREAAAADNL